MRKLPLLLVWLLVCSCAGDGGMQTAEVVSTDSAADGRGGDVVLGPTCQTVADCDDESPCIVSARCEKGQCQYEEAVAGTPCEEGCFIGGTCSAGGVCTGTQMRECPEADGNLCTVPRCEPATGACDEEVLADGQPPYAASDCWVGSVCVGGQQDNSSAQPSPLALECEAANETLDPFGCVDKVICVGGMQPCKEVYKVDGAQCWPEEEAADGSTCWGHSCLDGVCEPDAELDRECGEDDFPAQCGPECQACTRLECLWIDDPANPSNPTKQVRYCRPAATVGASCAADPCKVDEACAFGSQADGPLGKETLGTCTGGEGKGAAGCAEELGKPALDCILAGIACDADGGCAFDQAAADAYCLPPEDLCFDKEETYCTHLDAGENWDPETGCRVGWVELDCDDENPCTVDSCKNGEAGWSCVHQPLDGTKCDDGDPCMVGELCVEGVCAGAGPKCADADDDPCNDPECHPETGECLPPATDGLACDDGSACTVGDVCAAGGCLSGEALECNDGNVCNGKETCDPVAGCQGGTPLACSDEDVCNGVETCHPVDGCKGGQALVCDDGNVCTDDACDPVDGCVHGNNTAPCDDGSAATVGDVCLDGACVPGAPIDCDDGNPCTTDQPDAALGCKYVNNAKPCTDEDVCTDGDGCAGGECVPGPQVDCNDGQFCTTDSCHPVQGCKHAPLPDFTSCPGGLANTCIGGLCKCVPQCVAKVCGDDLCGGSCGECGADKECVDGQCQGGGELDPNGTYTLSPAPYYQCVFGFVTLSVPTVTLIDNGNSVTVSPVINNCCTLTGDTGKDGGFTAQCACGGGCPESYKLTGTFQNPTTFHGTFTVTFGPGDCFDCSTQSWNIMGTK